VRKSKLPLEIRRGNVIVQLGHHSWRGIVWIAPNHTSYRIGSDMDSVWGGVVVLNGLRSESVRLT
jgi:hypothetical protein